MFNTISFVSPFSLPFLSSFSLFFFPFKLSQCEICLWCCFFFRIRRLWRWVLITLIVFPFPSSFYASFLPFFLLWRSPLYPYPPLAVLLRLPNPFFNLLCALFQSLPRNQRNKRRRLLPKRLILVSPLSLFFFIFLFFYLFLQELIQVLEILSLQFLRGCGIHSGYWLSNYPEDWRFLGTYKGWYINGGDSRSGCFRSCFKATHLSGSLWSSRVQQPPCRPLSSLWPLLW